MSEVSRLIAATPDQVWNVLADGWMYPLFVVGATRMRDVDNAWPAVGTRIYHSVGVWPAVINDHTEVCHSDPGTTLGLRARAWPLGEADIEFRLEATASGTQVTLTEVVASGPGTLIPPPLKGLSLAWRNTETLRRLAFIAENRKSDAFP